MRSVNLTMRSNRIEKWLSLVSGFLALVIFSVPTQAQSKRYIVTIKHASTAAEATRLKAIWVPGLSKSYARDATEAGQVGALHESYLGAIRGDITAKVPTGRRTSFANSVVRISHFPILVMTPNDEELAVIKAHPHTASVNEEGMSHSSLDRASKISRYESSRYLGNAGAGQLIAIIDGTFDLNHPMLSGKVVNIPSPSEACFSSGNGPGS
jgi:hypothetical protein